MVFTGWFREANAVLLLWLLATMLVETVTKYVAARKLEVVVGGKWWREEYWGNMLDLAFIVPAMALDWIIIHISPAAFRDDLVAYNWVTKWSLIFLILYQVIQTVKHVRDGGGAIPPAIERAIDFIIRRDRERMHSRDPSVSQRATRWYEDMTPAEKAELAEEIRKHELTKPT